LRKDFTGATLPDGADAIVLQEDASELGDDVEINGCREGWIEVLPIGGSDKQVAEYIAQIYADKSCVGTAMRAAQEGLCLSDIKRVMTVEEEVGSDDAQRFIDKIMHSHSATNGPDS
jgi:hypothetical protein